MRDELPGSRSFSRPSLAWRFSTIEAIEQEVFAADVVIGAVLVPGASAPKLISREMLKSMQRGSVLVDVAIDQGGCFETSHATTHADPTYEVDGVVHYCVANMPGAVPVTSSQALNNATLPFGLALANKGFAAAIEDPADNPEVVAQFNDRSAIVRKCLKQLSPAHQEIIDLVYYHEKSIAEISEIIRAPQNTVKTRMFYARKKMTGLLNAEGIGRVWS